MPDNRNGQPPTSRGSSPITPESAAKSLSRLFACFPEADLTEETKTDRFRGYMIAVEVFDLAILAEAVDDILKGNVMIDGERLNPKFMPTPPQLNIICQQVQHRRFVRTKPRIAYTRLPDPPERTPEEKARVAAKLAEARKTIGSTPEWQPEERNPLLVEIARKAREKYPHPCG